jgi:hypothetical protein
MTAKPASPEQTPEQLQEQMIHKVRNFLETELLRKLTISQVNKNCFHLKLDGMLIRTCPTLAVAERNKEHVKDIMRPLLERRAAESARRDSATAAPALQANDLCVCTHTWKRHSGPEGRDMCLRDDCLCTNFRAAPLAPEPPRPPRTWTDSFTEEELKNIAELAEPPRCLWCGICPQHMTIASGSVIQGDSALSYCAKSPSKLHEYATLSAPPPARQQEAPATGREQKLEEIAERLKATIELPRAFARNSDDQFFLNGDRVVMEFYAHDGGYDVNFEASEKLGEFLIHAQDDIRYLLRDNEGLQNTNEALRLALSRVSGERDAAQSALCDYTDMLQNARDRAEVAESELARLKQAAVMAVMSIGVEDLKSIGLGKSQASECAAIVTLCANRIKAALASSPLAAQPKEGK